LLARPKAVRCRGLTGRDSDRVDAVKLFGIDGMLIIKKDRIPCSIRTCKRRSSFEVQAIAHSRFRHLEAERPHKPPQFFNSVPVRAARDAYIEAPSNAHDVTAVEMSALNRVQGELALKSGCGALRFAGPRRSAGTRDDGVCAKQDGSVLDEDGVRRIRKIGETHDL
jgi:hypothetical protein